MVTLLGNHKLAKFGDVRVWSERGLICLEDGRDNTYDTITVDDALARAQAINDMLNNSRAHKRLFPVHRLQINRFEDFLERLIEAIRQAQAHGSPYDETAIDELERRSPTSVLVPHLPSF